MLNSLSVPQTGLYGAKIAVENVSNNIANENTPGYKKRVVQLSEVAHGNSKFTGRGLSSDSTYRVTSQYLYEKILSEDSKMSYHDKLSNMLGTVEKIFKETKNSGLASDIKRYFKSIENLRSNPNSGVYKNNLKSHATLLVKSMQNIYKSMNNYQDLVRKELNESIRMGNKYLNEIVDINYKLEKYSSTSRNDLFDKRDALEKKLSKLFDIQVVRHKGTYELKISGKTALHNTFTSGINLKEKNKEQVDRFVKDDGITSNVNFGPSGFDADDTITYKLNNEHQVSVKFGESIDLDGDGTLETIDQTNYVRALVYKINKDPNMSNLVEAHNGHPKLTSNPNVDKFLNITSKVEGTKGKFEGYLAIEKKTGSTVDERKTFYKDDYQSQKAVDSVALYVHNEEVKSETGSIKAQIENLQSDSSLNKIQNYKDKLDLFAKTLADVTDQYISISENKYTYGESTVDTKTGDISKIGLFSGSSVMNLKFNSTSISDLKQKDLEYLATIQWKKDISYTGKAQDSSDINAKSFTSYYEEVRLSVSINKEDNDFLVKSQKTVVHSLEGAHDQLTKVDKDEQMIDLIKFQSAYTSNAKVITTIDEMLKTLLGIKK